MIFWTIAFRNVRKNWRHSLSALLSLSASFVSLVLFDGYIDNLKKLYEDSFRHRQMLGDLIIEKPNIHEKVGLAEPWKFYITENDQVVLEKFFKDHEDLVSQRIRFLNFQGMVTNGSQSTILLGRGYDLKEGVSVRGNNWAWNATYGLPLEQAKEEAPISLGQGLAKKLGCYWKQIQFNTFSGGYDPVERPFECPNLDLQISTMTADAQLNAIDVKVTGLLDAGYKDIDDRYAVVPLPMAQMLLNTKAISFLSLELKDRSRIDEFFKLFTAEVENQVEGIKAVSWKDHIAGETYLKTMDLLAIFRNFVVVVILVISTLSVINTLIKIIKERSREIGTLRSIGFKSKQVLKMFLYETLLLSVIGTVLGFFAATFLTFFMNSLHIRYKAGMLSEPVLFQINFTAYAYLNAFIVLVVVSILACLFSTRHALSRKVIENLNHV